MKKKSPSETRIISGLKQLVSLLVVAGAGVGVLASVGGSVASVTPLHRLVSRQVGATVMLPALCSRGRVARVEADKQRFADARPKKEAGMDPLVAVHRKCFVFLKHQLD